MATYKFTLTGVVLNGISTAVNVSVDGTACTCTDSSGQAVTVADNLITVARADKGAVVVTLKADVLDNAGHTPVTVAAGDGNTYVLDLDGTVTGQSKVTNVTWSYDAEVATATANGVTSPAGWVANGTDTITYATANSSGKNITLSGVNAAPGNKVEIRGAYVYVTDDSLINGSLSVSGKYYSLALAPPLQSAEIPAGFADTATDGGFAYNAAYTPPGGYKVNDKGKIESVAASGTKDTAIFKLQGLSSTAGVTVTENNDGYIVDVNEALSNGNFTAATDITLTNGTGTATFAALTVPTTPTVNTNATLLESPANSGNYSYTSAGYSAYFALDNTAVNPKITCKSATAGTEYTVTGLKAGLDDASSITFDSVNTTFTLTKDVLTSTDVKITDNAGNTDGITVTLDTNVTKATTALDGTGFSVNNNTLTYKATGTSAGYLTADEAKNLTDLGSHTEGAQILYVKQRGGETFTLTGISAETLSTISATSSLANTGISLTGTTVTVPKNAVDKSSATTTIKLSNDNGSTEFEGTPAAYTLALGDELKALVKTTAPAVDASLTTTVVTENPTDTATYTYKASHTGEYVTEVSAGSEYTWHAEATGFDTFDIGGLKYNSSGKLAVTAGTASPDDNFISGVFVDTQAKKVYLADDVLPDKPAANDTIALSTNSGYTLDMSDAAPVDISAVWTDNGNGSYTFTVAGKTAGWISDGNGGYKWQAQTGGQQFTIDGLRTGLTVTNNELPVKYSVDTNGAYTFCLTDDVVATKLDEAAADNTVTIALTDTADTTTSYALSISGNGSDIAALSTDTNGNKAAGWSAEEVTVAGVEGYTYNSARTAYTWTVADDNRTVNFTPRTGGTPEIFISGLPETVTAANIGDCFTFTTANKIGTVTLTATALQALTGTDATIALSNLVTDELEKIVLALPDGTADKAEVDQPAKLTANGTATDAGQSYVFTSASYKAYCELDNTADKPTVTFHAATPVKELFTLNGLAKGLTADDIAVSDENAIMLTADMLDGHTVTVTKGADAAVDYTLALFDGTAYEAAKTAYVAEHPEDTDAGITFDTANAGKLVNTDASYHKATCTTDGIAYTFKSGFTNDSCKLEGGEVTFTAGVDAITFVISNLLARANGVFVDDGNTSVNGTVPVKIYAAKADGTVDTDAQIATIAYTATEGDKAKYTVTLYKDAVAAVTDDTTDLPDDITAALSGTATDIDFEFDFTADTEGHFDTYTAASGTCANNTYTYTGEKHTGGYGYATATDKTKLVANAAVAATTFTLTGVDIPDDATVTTDANGTATCAKDGNIYFTVDGDNKVTVFAKALPSTKTAVTLTDATKTYSLTLGDGVTESKPVSEKVSANNGVFTYTAAGTTAGYVVDDDGKIVYKTATGGQNFTVTNLKLTGVDGLEVGTDIIVDDNAKTVTLSGKVLANGLFDADTTLAISGDGYGDYKLALGNGVTESAPVTEKISIDNGVFTYTAAGTTAGYVVDNDGKIVYKTATGGQNFTVSGLKNSGVALGTNVTVDNDTHTVTVHKDALAAKDITFTDAVGVYTLTLDGIATAKPETADGTVTIANGNATYVTKTTAEYYDFDRPATDTDTGAKTYRYHEKDGGDTIVVKGLLSTATAGVTFSENDKAVTVTIDDADILTANDVELDAVPDGYGVTFAVDEKVPTVAAATDAWGTVTDNTVTYTTGTSAFYTVDGQKLKYTAAASTDVLELAGVKSTANLSTVKPVDGVFKFTADIGVDAGISVSSNAGKFAFDVAAMKFFGSADDDTISVTGGTVSGGNGSDTFVVGTGTDIIVDYKADDKIRLDPNVFANVDISGTDVTFSDGNGNSVTVINGADGKPVTFVNANGNVISSKAYSATDSDIDDMLRYNAKRTAVTLNGSNVTGDKVAFTPDKFTPEDYDGTVVSISAADVTTAKLYISGNAQNNFITAGTGGNSIDGGTGTDTVTAGDGSDTLVFHAGNGLLIRNFGDDDKIQLVDSTAVTASVKGNDVIFTLDDGGNVTVNGGASVTSAADGLQIQLVDETGNIISANRYNRFGILDEAGTSISLNGSDKSFTASGNITDVDATNSTVVTLTGNGGGYLVANKKRNVLVGNGDSLVGGRGNDTFVVGDGDFVADCNTGDKISLSAFDMSEVTKVSVTQDGDTSKSGTVALTFDGGEVSIHTADTGKAIKFLDGDKVTAFRFVNGGVAKGNSVTLLNAPEGTVDMTADAYKPFGKVTAKVPVTVTGSAGNDVFIYDGGDITITDYGNGFDKISLRAGWSVTDVADGVLTVSDGDNSGTIALQNCDNVKLVTATKTKKIYFGDHVISDSADISTAKFVTVFGGSEFSGNNKSNVIVLDDGGSATGGLGNDTYIVKGGDVTIRDFGIGTRVALNDDALIRLPTKITTVAGDTYAPGKDRVKINGEITSATVDEANGSFTVKLNVDYGDDTGTVTLENILRNYRRKNGEATLADTLDKDFGKVTIYQAVNGDEKYTKVTLAELGITADTSSTSSTVDAGSSIVAGVIDDDKVSLRAGWTLTDVADGVLTVSDGKNFDTLALTNYTAGDEVTLVTATETANIYLGDHVISDSADISTAKSVTVFGGGQSDFSSVSGNVAAYSVTSIVAGAANIDVVGNNKSNVIVLDDGGSATGGLGNDTYIVKGGDVTIRDFGIGTRVALNDDALIRLPTKITTVAGKKDSIVGYDGDTYAPGKDRVKINGEITSATVTEANGSFTVKFNVDYGNETGTVTLENILRNYRRKNGEAILANTLDKDFGKVTIYQAVNGDEKYTKVTLAELGISADVVTGDTSLSELVDRADLGSDITATNCDTFGDTSGDAVLASASATSNNPH